MRAVTLGRTAHRAGGGTLPLRPHGSPTLTGHDVTGDTPWHI